MRRQGTYKTSMENKYIIYLVWFVVLAAVAVGVWKFCGSGPFLPIGNCPFLLHRTMCGFGSFAGRTRPDGCDCRIYGVHPAELVCRAERRSRHRSVSGLRSAGSAPPACKIEISALPNPASVSLSDWLHSYFQEDPTADIVQESVTGSEISGYPAATWTDSRTGFPQFSRILRGGIPCTRSRRRSSKQLMPDLRRMASLLRLAPWHTAWMPHSRS